MLTKPIDAEPVKGIVESADLQILGLTQLTERSLGTFQIICGGWNICNSWAGIVGTLAIGISEGGTVLLLYGIVIMLVFGGCCATTLAGLAGVYPTAGGQYHWTSILSPKKSSRVLVRSMSPFKARLLTRARATAAAPSIFSAGSQSAQVSLFSRRNSSFPWQYTTIQVMSHGHGIIF